MFGERDVNLEQRWRRIDGKRCRHRIENYVELKSGIFSTKFFFHMGRNRNGDRLNGANRSAATAPLTTVKSLNEDINTRVEMSLHKQFELSKLTLKLIELNVVIQENRNKSVFENHFSHA